MAKSIQFSRSHKDYWKDKVKKLPYKDKKSGKSVLASDYSIRLSFSGRREYFSLYTANKKIACDKAREIDSSLRKDGWELTLSKYKPKAQAKAEIETVGDLIEVSKAKAEVRPMTLRQYHGALRRIVSSIRSINSNDVSKFRPGGSDWQQKVDKVKLVEITADSVLMWRKFQLEKLNPAERESKEKSVNSVLNQARSLWRFSGLPSPFKNLKWKGTTIRFEPSVDAETLLHYAEQELEEQHPEQFKAFALCLYFGLRKAEADCLTWEQVDLEHCKVRIETTKYFQPKSKHSKREVRTKSPISTKMTRWREGADKVFVLKGAKAKPLSTYTYYRADKTWKQLTVWLQSKGVEASMPVHYLRKLPGSLMYNYEKDIYAAQRFLGHSNINTTLGSYVHGGDASFELVAKKPVGGLGV